MGLLLPVVVQGAVDERNSRVETSPYIYLCDRHTIEYIYVILRGYRWSIVILFVKIILNINANFLLL